MIVLRALALLLLVAPAAQVLVAPPARAMRLRYVAYAAGLRVVELRADVDLAPDDYRIDLTLRTVGLFGAFVSGLTTTEVTGRWDGLAAVPHRYDTHGKWRGTPLSAVIDYLPQGPRVSDLEPDPDPDERDTVPADLQVGTVDTLSGMAALVRRLSAGDGCDTRARLFDGRRLSEVAATTVGTEVLAPTPRSMFQGPALRCDFQGRLLAGFPADEDPARAARPKSGSAWFAALSPGGPTLPVRIVFETRFFGHATMYLAGVDPDSQRPGETP
jgi:hypothetical protein